MAHLPPDDVKTTLRRELSKVRPPTNVTGNIRPETGAAQEEWPKFTDDDKVMPSYYVTEWEAFNLDNLNKIYGHILDVPVSDVDIPVPEPWDVLGTFSVDIKTDTDIHKLITWNATMLEAVLEWARSRLHLDPNIGHCQIYQGQRLKAKGKPPILRIPALPEGTSGGRVDHLLSLDVWPWKHLIVGVTRPTAKFDSRTFLENPSKKGNHWAVRYLAQQCRRAGTRYGYIMSERNLTVCRFSIHRDDGKTAEWHVSCKPIPWSTYGENALTTDLALVWLSLLALSGDRTIVEHRFVTEINHS